MAEEKETTDEGSEGEGGSGESEVEKRIAKLEKSYAETLKALEQERKNSAGRDKKIDELNQEKKALQEATYSKDKLLEIRDQEQKEREMAWQQQQATERAELEKLRVEQLRLKVLSKLEVQGQGFPSFLMDRVHGGTEEEIEADARGIMSKWVKERDKVDNARKVTGQPKSGNGRQLKVTVEDLKAMSPQELKKWTEQQYSGKGRGTNAEADALLEELSQG